MVNLNLGAYLHKREKAKVETHHRNDVLRAEHENNVDAEKHHVYSALKKRRTFVRERDRA